MAIELAGSELIGKRGAPGTVDRVDVNMTMVTDAIGQRVPGWPDTQRQSIVKVMLIVRTGALPLAIPQLTEDLASFRLAGRNLLDCLGPW